MNIRINSDQDLVREAKKQLIENDGYCPCSLEKTPDTKCMCKDFREKVQNGYKGECHCGLYESI